MKKFQIFESPSDRSIFLQDELGAIFLPCDENGGFQFLNLESANQLRFFTDGNTIYSATGNSGLGWIELAIQAGMKIFGAVSSSQAQKKANASAERQLQLQNQQLEIQQRIQQQQAELANQKKSNPTPLIIGGVTIALFGIGLAIFFFNRDEKKSKKKELKETK